MTSHFGKAYDIGCVSVRQMKTTAELPVVWSAYQDVMPVFCLVASPAHIITLEVVRLYCSRFCLRLLQISCDGCKQYVM